MGVDIHPHQFLRLLDRQGAKAHRVDELKDGGVGARAKRQREDRDNRKDRIAPEQPEAVPKILPGRLKEVKGIHLVNLFADSSDVSKLPMRLARRIGWRHAAGDVVGGLVRQIVLELGRALVVPLAAAEKA